MLCPAPTFSSEPVHLVLGDGWALVRQTGSVAITGALSSVELGDIPDEADLTSRAIWSRRYPVKLLSWARGGRLPDTPLATNQGDLTWQPTRAGIHGIPDAPVRVMLESPALGDREVVIAYLMTGIVWQARYNAVIRGDLTNELDVLAIDLEAAVILSNATSRSFHDAQIHLVTARSRPDVASQNDAGFFMMDEDDPLSDLWMKEEVVQERIEEYPVPGLVSLAAGTEVRVPLARAQRQPARRLYGVQWDDFAGAGDERGAELERWIVLRNDPSVGLGVAMPAGWAQIYVGGLRNALYQFAWFGHTPRAREIRISLGTSDRVRASRRFVDRTQMSRGLSRETYQMEIQNELESVIALEIDERPQTTLSWTVEKVSGADYFTQGRRIVFTANVNARSTLRIQYVLVVQEPSDL